MYICIFRTWYIWRAGISVAKRELYDMEAARSRWSCACKGRGDGNPAIRARNLDPRQGARRYANGTQQVSPTDHWLPAPTTPRPPHLVRQGPYKGTKRERQDDYPQAASPVCGGRTADANCTTHASGDVWNDGWRGESRTRATRKDLGPMSSRQPQGGSSHRGIHGKRQLGVWRRNGAMAHGG